MKTKRSHPLYRTWRGIKERTSLTSTTNRRHNNGRYDHVSMCEEWRSDFWRFVDDVGERPVGYTLDRIDPYGDYEPGNVRWSSVKSQNRNRRGQYMSLPLAKYIRRLHRDGWALRTIANYTGVKYSSVLQIVYRLKWL